MNSSLQHDHALVFYGPLSEFADACDFALISESEIARAQDLREPDRQRYLVSRIILKQISACFLQNDAQKIEISYGVNGKPFLSGFPELQFNMSHSGHILAFGFTWNRAIGVDIEDQLRSVNRVPMEKFLFTADELAILNSVPDKQRQEAFINSWTRKEALLKATGEGLTRSMNELEIAFTKNQPFHLSPGKYYVPNEPAWFIQSTVVMDTYSLSTATNGLVKSVDYIPVSMLENALNNVC
jgi:phosphopantetheinyl transferase